MDTAIGYLELVREDLLEAGAGERRRARHPRGIGGRPSARTLIAAASVATLVAAGTIGWFVTRTDEGYGADSGRRTAGRPTTVESPAPADEQASLGYTPFIDELSGNALEVLPTWAGTTTLTEDAARVIRTAELGLEIPRDSFDARFAQATDAAEASGGFVAASTTRERSGSVTMRVPAPSFGETLAELRSLGEVEVQTIQGRDVTAEYVDLNARLRIAKARRDVLLRLMDDATTIEQTIRVQNALDDTQLRIEELQGQVNLLDDRTSLATIRLELHEEGTQPVQEVDTPSIPNAFERSVAGFVGVIAGIVVGLGYLVPVLLIALAAWYVVARIRRRRVA
ncbi:MAG: DUF4349 domain-containing protein [Actinomycetota bacterium]